MATTAYQTPYRFYANFRVRIFDYKALALGGHQQNGVSADKDRRQAAEDVAQDSFLLAHQGIASLPAGSTDGAGVILAMTRCPLGPAQKGRGDV